MSMLRAIRTLNAIETGALNAASLESLLADAGRLSEWAVLVNLRGQVERMLASPATMNAVFGSARAAKTFLSNPRARAALYNPDFLSIFAPSAWGVYAPHADQLELGGANGTEVARWRNALGITSRDMVQATSSNRPVLNSTSTPLPGIQTLNFDGTDDVLACSEAFNQPSGYTVLAVYRRSTLTEGPLFGDTTGGLGVSSTVNAGYGIAAGTSQSFSNAGGALNAWAMSRYSMQSTASLSHSLNGGAESTIASANVPTFGALAQIGAGTIQSTPRRFNGRIAEVWLLAGNGVATSPEVVRATNMLKFKYGL